MRLWMGGFRCPCCSAELVIDRARIGLSDDDVFHITDAVVQADTRPGTRLGVADNRLAAERDRIRETKEFFRGPEQLPDGEDR